MKRRPDWEWMTTVELRSWLAIASKMGRRGSVEVILLVVREVKLEAIGLVNKELGRRKAFREKSKEAFREQNIAEGREEGTRSTTRGLLEEAMPRGKGKFRMHGGGLGVQIFGRIVMDGLEKRRRSAEEM